jgi:putative oxidoreductase
MKKFLKFITATNESGYSWGLLIIRVVAGVLMMTHGYAKIENFSKYAEAFPDPLGVGSTISLSLIISAEFFASIFLILGLFTRLALIPLIFGMGVVVFVIHGADPMQVKELAVIYMVIYIGLIISGPGKFSIDRLLSK